MKRYAETGQHPGPLPTPGVFARHNAVDTPALLPDGTRLGASVSATLRARGTVADSRDLVKPSIQRTLRRDRPGREAPQRPPSDDDDGAGAIRSSREDERT